MAKTMQAAIQTNKLFGNRHVYAKVFARVIEEMERGKLVWVKPWAASGEFMPMNASSKRPYHGGNVLALWAAQQMYEFKSARWLTFRQAKAAGGGVKKGEHGTPVYFMTTLDKKDKATGEKTGETWWLARAYTVFNLDQCWGVEDLYPAETVESVKPQIAACEAMVAATGAEIREVAGDSAHYNRGTDRIQMPLRTQFPKLERFYGTLFHELVHWTGHETRTRRHEDPRFTRGAREELVAELGAAFLGARFRIAALDQSAAYLQSWLTDLRDDPSALAHAASAAWKAADFLHPAEAADVDEALEEAA